MVIDKINFNELSEEVIWKWILEVRKKGKKNVITSINLLSLAGAPVSSNEWILKEKTRIKKIKKILSNLEAKGKLVKRELKQEYKGYKEIGYNVLEAK